MYWHNPTASPPPDPVADLARLNTSLRAMGLSEVRGDDPGLAPDIREAMQDDRNRLRLALMMFGHEDPPGAWLYAVRRGPDVNGWPTWDIHRVRPCDAPPEGFNVFQKVPLF